MTRENVRIIALLLIFVPLTAASATAAPTKSKPRYFRQQAVKTPKSQPPGIEVVNAASFLPGVSPGALATIFGPDLSDVSGVVVAQEIPLPLELSGVAVRVNGVPAPLFGVANTTGQDQISFQVPFDTETGPNAVHIEILDFGETVGVARDGALSRRR